MTESNLSNSLQTSNAEELRKKLDQYKNVAKMYFLGPIRRHFSYLGQGFAVDSSWPMHFTVTNMLIYQKLNLRLFN